MIKAQIIADSKNEFGNRLTTFVLTFPRIILSEFNTHRMLSRNSASSRAIPFKKMLKMVQEDPFIPIKWMKEHTGMQGTEYITGEKEVKNRVNTWLRARDSAIKHAEELNSESMVTYHSGDTNDYDSFIPPVTKQICNRLLEPFMWHTCICTASEWENFFALRAHKDAEIHIQELAYKMLEEYNNSTPKQLKEGEWHIPFGDKITEDWSQFEDALYNGEKITWAPNGGYERAVQELEIKIATARCARVSYMNFEGKNDYMQDVVLHDRLLYSGHMSPLEHCAKSMTEEEYDLWTSGKLVKFDGPLGTVIKNDGYTEGWCGNFRGFIQYRKTIKEENKSDSRVKRKI